MGSTGGCSSTPFQASGSVCPPQTSHPPCSLASAAVLARHHLRCHSFPAALFKLAAVRNSTEGLPAFTPSLPEMDCTSPQPNATGYPAPAGRQIAYAQPPSSRIEIPLQENRLQPLQRLKE